MKKPRSMRTIGPLEVIEIPGTPGAPCVVMMHGYGADASDLVSLSHLLHTPPGTTWLFPNGPVKVAGPGYVGRAWFDLDTAKLEAAMASGQPLNMGKSTPSGLKDARENIFEMLKVLQIPPSQVVFAGFSQGSMVAVDAALKCDGQPMGLAILSGNLINEDVWKQRAPSKKGLLFFQSHGDVDQVLGVEYARSLEKLLQQAGLRGELMVFHGGHEIPQDVIYNLDGYLRLVLRPAKERN